MHPITDFVVTRGVFKLYCIPYSLACLSTADSRIVRLFAGLLEHILQVLSVLSSAAKAVPAISGTGQLGLVGLVEVEPEMIVPEVSWYQVDKWLLH